MKIRYSLMSAIGALVLTGAAQADTVATFADPAVSPATPLFSLTGNVLTGGWSGLGLNLLTPGTAAPDYSNVTFTITPLVVLPVAPGFGITNAGQINFFDGANPIFRIEFDSGFLTSPASFGGSDFVGQNVRFSGAVLGGAVSSSEAFAFSFANPTPFDGGYTVTSAFTSSADLRIPGPATLMAMGTGLLAVGRRRRA
jgi:hypothetical protein